MGRNNTRDLELDLTTLPSGKVLLPGEAPSSSDVALQLRLTAIEVRAMVQGARLLGVPVSRLVSWAGSVNPEETVLHRWHRPYVDETQLVHLSLMLDADGLRVACVLAERFDIDVETYLAARTFDWLRRIRERHLADPSWQRLEVPAARIGWRIEPNDRTGLKLA